MRNWLTKNINWDYNFNSTVIHFSKQQKTVLVQLAVAFAQVNFGIACATLFTPSIDLSKAYIIITNFVLTLFFSAICVLLIPNK